jgi:hypothetical protein
MAKRKLKLNNPYDPAEVASGLTFTQPNGPHTVHITLTVDRPDPQALIERRAAATVNDLVVVARIVMSNDHAIEFARSLERVATANKTN